MLWPYEKCSKAKRTEDLSASKSHEGHLRLRRQVMEHTKAVPFESGQDCGGITRGTWTSSGV